MAGAGALREIFAFGKRTAIDDGYGNTEAGFSEQFRCAAGAMAMVRGRGEDVIAGRLTGVQPYTVTVRYCAQTVAITSDWCARDVRAGAVYDIAVVAARPKRDYIDLLCTIGKAA